MSGAAPEQAVRILLMDDHRLFASALQARLEQDPRFDVVGVVSRGADALRLVSEVAPDVVLLDAGLLDVEPVLAMRSIADSKGAPRVLILADADDELGAVEAHDAGASAFLRKPRSAADLLETIELATVLISAAVEPPS